MSPGSLPQHHPAAPPAVPLPLCPLLAPFLASVSPQAQELFWKLVLIRTPAGSRAQGEGQVPNEPGVVTWLNALLESKR